MFNQALQDAAQAMTALATALGQDSERRLLLLTPFQEIKAKTYLLGYMNLDELLLQIDEVLLKN